MKLSFHGGAQDVTGSCFLLRVGARRLRRDGHSVSTPPLGKVETLN